MRLMDLWTRRERPTLSFEFFPPRDEKAAARLDKVVDKLLPLDPDFVSVTFGAGGSTREGSLDLVKRLRGKTDRDVVAYIAAYGLGPGTLTDVLNQFREIGVETILCVRGDEPRNVEEFHPDPDCLPYAKDLLAFVRDRFDYCIGAAGYPEGHVTQNSLDLDIQHLKSKVDHGAQYIISQFFFDNNYFIDFVKRCRTAGINVPILAGIMPVYSIGMLNNFVDLCGTTVPDTLKSGLDALPPDDKDALGEFAVNFALDQCRGLLDYGVDGLHFYTMNRSKAVAQIVRQLRADTLI